MASKRSKLINDGDKDQETLNPTDQQILNHLTLLAHNAAAAAADDRKAKENLLKRPRTACPASNRPPQQVFDSETDDDDAAAAAKDQDPTLPTETHRELADQIPKEYKNLMNFMGLLPDSNPIVVAEKRLTRRDVDERRNRLLIPTRKTRFDFLKLEEEEELNRRKWLPVEIIEPDGSVSLVTLSKWETKTGPAYVFITEWSGLVERNQLKEGDFLQLWSFRTAGAGTGKYGRLCFMLLEIGD